MRFSWSSVSICLYGRSRSSLKCLTARAEFSGMHCRNGEVEQACKAFEFAIYGRTFEGAAFIAKGGLLPAMVAIFFDQLVVIFVSTNPSKNAFRCLR